jgi:hypothetical protein
MVVTTHNPSIPGDGGRCDRGYDFVRRMIRRIYNRCTTKEKDNNTF